MTTLDPRPAGQAVPPDPRLFVSTPARRIIGELALEYAGEVLDQPRPFAQPGASLAETRHALRVVGAQLHHAMAEGDARRARTEAMRHRPECLADGPLRCVCELGDNVEPF
jgi:hypothetical protein